MENAVIKTTMDKKNGCNSLHNQTPPFFVHYSTRIFICQSRNGLSAKSFQNSSIIFPREREKIETESGRLPKSCFTARA